MDSFGKYASSPSLPGTSFERHSKTLALVVGRRAMPVLAQAGERQVRVRSQNARVSTFLRLLAEAVRRADVRVTILGDRGFRRAPRAPRVLWARPSVAGGRWLLSTMTDMLTKCTISQRWMGDRGGSFRTFTDVATRAFPSMHQPRQYAAIK